MSPKSPSTRIIHREPGFTLSPASIPSNTLSTSFGTPPTSPSLLSARRPSITTGFPSFHSAGTTYSSSGPSISNKDGPALASLPEQTGLCHEPGSPDDGGNFRRSLQIDMKDLVGDAVGNMSISPASRDVVLAARRGLFIIDLESPLEVPRFLPQGGTWDVADVQWNPHNFRAEYIVSTSSEKLLIWNLALAGKTSIEFILHKHYRAITDINWHTTEWDTVASTGIDSWVWAWDLRTPNKPIFGLSAFNESGTQVKWNRQDANILASSHANEVLIWDRRKGSLPVTCIPAHNSKIYGIDWSHSRRNEIITCSLDHTIKVWHVDVDKSDCSNARNNLPRSNRMYEPTMMEPEACIRTTYPVWRARSLPFAPGILSLPQRSETALEMYRTDEASSTDLRPVEIFEGHTDVVKEFVWRRGGQDGTEYQLITWSKDRTLRFWPIDSETMQKAGYAPPRGRPRYKIDPSHNVTFRRPPEGTWFAPALSAPVGHRSILAEVRAPPPRLHNPVLYPHHGSSLRASQHENLSTLGTSPATYVPRPSLHLPSSVGDKGTENRIGALPVAMGDSQRTGTMSRGGFGGRSVARMDALTWLSNVKVNQRRSSSSGPGSRCESTAPSRISSRSRPPSGSDRRGQSRPPPDLDMDAKRRRSESNSRSTTTDEKKEQEGNQSLQDEITSVLTKLTAYGVKLEKFDLAKKRTCTIGLNGPWGATSNSSVFIRVTFTFPKEYPYGIHPEGTPTVEIDRNRLMPIQNRAAIIRRLRAVRERRRPCLEPCLRFLLTKKEDASDLSRPRVIDSDTSSDDDRPSTRKSREATVTMLRGSKNLAEPRTSQATFGPNGELICFFRAPPRIVRNILRDFPHSTPKSTEHEPQDKDPAASPRVLQSPAVVSDALRRLGQASTDKNIKMQSLRRSEDGAGDILRITTNLLTYSRGQNFRDPSSMLMNEVPQSYALATPRRSMIFIDNINTITGPDRKVASGYIFTAPTLEVFCDHNAKVARSFRRYDHERAFMTLRSVVSTLAGSNPPSHQLGFLSYQVVKLVYARFAEEKDLQMLAMMSVLLLHTRSSFPDTGKEAQSSFKQNAIRRPLSPLMPPPTGLDYFSLTKAISGGGSPILPNRQQAPSSPVISQISQTRSSWSSLFNAGSMRQLMVGTQEVMKETSPVTSEPTSTALMSEKGITVPSQKKMMRSPGSPLSPRAGKKKDNVMRSPSAVSRSWNEAFSSTRGSAPFPSPGPLSRTESKPLGLHRIKFIQSVEKQTESLTLWSEPGFIDQLIKHIYAYAELLFRWQMYHKRLELLNCPGVKGQLMTDAEQALGVDRFCGRCRIDVRRTDKACPSCLIPCTLPLCSVCRLPAKGLSRSCMRCLHVTHVSCYRTATIQWCATGCGCLCFNASSDQPSPTSDQQTPLSQANQQSLH